MTPLDWGVGRYEATATQLTPAARVVVDQAAPMVGEHVVDVGCGTGNAALLAAERGAEVIGIDPAPRLLDVGRHRAAAQQLDIAFAVGEAAALPIDSGAADVVLSVFGVIFAADPHAAASELARVTAPGGRILLSAWIPEGAVHDVARTAEEAVRRAFGAPAAAPPFPWHKRRALGELLAPHGFEVTTAEMCLTFTGRSPDAYVDDQADHPQAVAARSVLGPVEGDAVRARILEIYQAANEDAGAFRVTSRYIVATARRRV